MNTEMPAPMRPRAVGIWGAVFGLGTGAGPIVEVLITIADCRRIFLVNVPLAAITIAIIALGAAESRETTGRATDFSGAGISAWLP